MLPGSQLNQGGKDVEDLQSDNRVTVKIRPAVELAGLKQLPLATYVLRIKSNTVQCTVIYISTSRYSTYFLLPFCRFWRHANIQSYRKISAKFLFAYDDKRHFLQRQKNQTFGAEWRMLLQVAT